MLEVLDVTQVVPKVLEIKVSAFHPALPYCSDFHVSKELLLYYVFVMSPQLIFHPALPYSSDFHVSKELLLYFVLIMSPRLISKKHFILLARQALAFS